MRKHHKENQDGQNQAKLSLERLEQVVIDVKDQMGEDEEKMRKLGERVSMSEDTGLRHHWAL